MDKTLTLVSSPDSISNPPSPISNPQCPSGEISTQTPDKTAPIKPEVKEAGYEPEEWVLPKLEQIKCTGSLETHTVIVPSSVQANNNIISMNIRTSNNKSDILTTNLHLLFFQDGIVKFYCLNPANPSKFSFEQIEKPADLVPSPIAHKIKVQDTRFDVDMDDQTKLTVDFDPVKLTIVSTKDGLDDPMFTMNTNKSLMFDDNLTADLTFNTEYLYGIPQHAHHLLLEDSKQGLPYRFFNLDTFGYPPLSKNGLYGSAPLMLTRKKDSSKWASVFWQNGSETYCEIQKRDSMSNTYWISERGNLEAYVFINHSTKDHFQALSKVTGKCAMPQFFSLGYHQSRYSYHNQEDVLEVNAKMTEYEIPCDTLTLDIDHTDGFRYFTWNYKLFPNPRMIQDTLREHNRKLITVADPHIKVDQNYQVYQHALSKDLFVKDKEKKDFIGECWPGACVYIDFLNKDAQDYWASCYSYEHYTDSTPTLFAWNDMTEPSVYKQKYLAVPKENFHLIKPLEEPDKPFLVEHREVRNLYGYCVSKSTYEGMLRRNKDQNIRPHVVGRSFFVGSQKWCTVWTGDSQSTWEQLKASVPMLLSLSLCGISFVGCDIGGFGGNPDPELLVRWYQLGIFMPYFRQHSDQATDRREPWLFPKRTLELIREAIRERYRLLPYWYTAFEENCRTGVPLLRPTWLDNEEKMDDEAMSDEARFMVGDALLVAPVLETGKMSLEDPVRGLQGRWYDYYTKTEIRPKEENKVEMERIGCYLKGGKTISLFDLKDCMKSSQDAKAGDINLYVGLDEKERSEGKTYFDDGETFDYRKGSFMRKGVRFEGDELVWENIGEGGYIPTNNVTKAVIMGLKSREILGAYLLTEGGEKQSVQVIKNVGNIVLEFVAKASKNWKIILH